ncbi:MAG: hypothetical protein J7647_01640 [Cyanobacteria bacterium SBLK]|nr:hypothetical protein [Cyanobacteria bacterium SBLK]
MPRNYSKSDPVWVPYRAKTDLIKYGFPCRLERDTAFSTLGINLIDVTALSEADLLGMVWGANSPKPPRATKKHDTNPPGYESTFCGNSATILAAARADGWKIRTGKSPRKPSETTRSKTVYVTINGINYAWQFAKLAQGVTVDVTQIGVKDATSNDLLVFGATFPKPPKMQRNINDPADPDDDTFSTFGDPSSLASAVENDWNQKNMKGANLTELIDFITLVS